MEENILEVKRLKISFRTNNGTVKAVRDISFNLKKGETLAIVGESGSGKSVTSKAILGILAGNSIIDGGEILFDGQDLLRISEDDMHKIRGDKIAMIFQDPLSSLNPIVKIGKQITEAMLLKNKASRKMARKEFNQTLATLKDNMIESLGENYKDEITSMISTFNKFNIKAIELENDFNDAYSVATEILSIIEDNLFLLERKQKVDYKKVYKNLLVKLKRIDNKFLLNGLTEEYQNNIINIDANKSSDDQEAFKNTLLSVKPFLEKATAKEKPNFFRIGYYVIEEPKDDIYSYDIHELNEKALEKLNNNFMFKFIEYAEKAVINSYEKSLQGKKKVVEELSILRNKVQNLPENKKDAGSIKKEMGSLIKESLYDLSIEKDSVACTFIRSLEFNIKSYYYSKNQNAKEEIRFEKQTNKYNILIEKGKRIDWKVVPKNIVSLDDIVENINSLIDRLEKRYTHVLETSENVNYKEISVSLVDYFKSKASEVVYKITKSMAKEKAIKLMEEVGIPEPRIRYYQYPFEFSGGMRQRIVIAIALSANPEILICDEPTTALDVTIQSQILELINELKVQRNISVIFITHDLGVVANMADRIAVMYAGKIVETGTSEEIFYNPRHPYTWALLSSMPDLDTKEKLEAIPGTPPNMIYPPIGDAFAQRNKYALKIDFEKEPPLFKISDTHYAATWLLHKDAPKVEVPKTITDRIKRMKEKQGE